MRCYVPEYELLVPEKIGAVLDLLDDSTAAWVPLAGGTDLMVLLAAGRLKQRRFISLAELCELRKITVSPGWITMGSLVTYTDILRHALLQNEFPLIASAAAETGAVAIQNRGTIGGNIANASPAADTPPALLAYDAEIELTSVHGSRWLSYHGFHCGYKQTHMKPNELITGIRLPRRSSVFRAAYRKIGPRKVQAISKVVFAGLRDRKAGEVRIALGGVAPVPLRCFRTEAAIREGRDPSEVLALEIAPIDDVRSTAAYRLRVAQNLLADFLSDEF